jgi:hypothetical protein
MRLKLTYSDSSANGGLFVDDLNRARNELNIHGRCNIYLEERTAVIYDFSDGMEDLQTTFSPYGFKAEIIPRSFFNSLKLFALKCSYAWRTFR